MVLLACGGLMTACSDSAAPPSGPPQVASAVSASADTATRLPRGAGGQVANPRAQLQAEFRKRPDFEEACRNAGVVSDRLAKFVGCPAGSSDIVQRTVGDEDLPPEILELIAEVEGLASALDAAWNPGPYSVSDYGRPLASDGVPVCTALMWTALGATSRAVIDVLAFGWGVRTRNLNLITSAGADARRNIPIAIAAVGTYFACEEFAGGGEGPGKRPR
jgi:hypothetical protein